MPFRGEITIQIVNQTGNHNHVENTDCYTDKTLDDTAGRVIDNGIAENGWGFGKFLAHTDLQYNVVKNTQFES